MDRYIDRERDGWIDRQIDIDRHIRERGGSQADRQTDNIQTDRHTLAH